MKPIYVLFQKKEKTNKVEDFRPISLITSLHKIIAKTLAGRLRRVLSNSISNYQGACTENFGLSSYG